MTPGGNASQERPIGAEPADEAEALAGDIVVSILVLLRVGDENLRLSADLDRLDPEGRESLLELRINERAGRVDRIPVAVEHVDAAIVEIGRVEELTIGDAVDGEALVHRAAPSCGTLITTGAPLNPEMVPSSPAKMKRAGLVPTPLVTTKPVPPLRTWPVGAPCWPIAPGTVTTMGMVPVPTLYSVERPVPVSEIHHGDVALRDTPQALTRLGSTRAACPAWSEIRLC